MREFKLEPGTSQEFRHDTAAFQDKFGFRLLKNAPMAKLPSIAGSNERRPLREERRIRGSDRIGEIYERPIEFFISTANIPSG